MTGVGTADASVWTADVEGYGMDGIEMLSPVVSGSKIGTENEKGSAELMSKEGIGSAVVMSREGEGSAVLISSEGKGSAVVTSR